MPAGLRTRSDLAVAPHPIGIPHDEWGEEVRAVVEPSAGVRADAELEQRLLAHCQAQLAKYKCPRKVEFRDALPRDPNGKLYKRLLRDPHWVGRDRQI